MVRAMRNFRDGYSSGQSPQKSMGGGNPPHFKSTNGGPVKLPREGARRVPFSSLSGELFHPFRIAYHLFNGFNTIYVIGDVIMDGVHGKTTLIRRSIP